MHSSEVCCDPCITRGASWFARSIWTSLDVTIFRNPRFLLMMIGSCLSVFGYMIPCVFIPSLAVTSLDMNPYKSALLLSVWAASTIVGRISSGLIVDRLPFFKSPDRRVYMYAVPNIFCGLCTATVYVIRSQDAFIFYCILFGFLTGKFKMLRRLQWYIAGECREADEHRPDDLKESSAENKLFRTRLSKLYPGDFISSSRFC